MNIYLAQIAATLALLSQTLAMVPVTNLDGGGAGGAALAQTQTATFTSYSASPNPILSGQMTTVSYSGTGLSMVNINVSCPVGVTAPDNHGGDACGRTGTFATGVNSTQILFNNNTTSNQQALITLTGYDASNTLVGTRTMYVAVASGIVATPIITRMSPTTAKAGDVINVYGSNLYGSDVLVAGGNRVMAGYSDTTGNSLYFYVPAAAPIGSVTVQAQKGSGSVSNSVILTVVSAVPVAPVEAPIVISSISPATVRAGDTVTLNGSGFASGIFIQFLKGAGMSVVPTVLSSSQMSFVVPQGVSGIQIIQAIMKGSGAASNTMTITIADTASTATPLPKIIGLLPTTVKAGDTMSVYGSGLYGNVLVVDGAYGIPPTSVNPEGDYATFVVPANFVQGTHTIRFEQKATGAAGNTVTFEVVPIGVPYVRIITPPSAKVGDVITMMGSDIDQLGSITIDGVEIGAPKYVDPAGKYFTFVVPNTSVGKHVVQVFQKATGAPGNQQQLIVMESSGTTSTVGTPTITLFSAKDINPTTNGTMLIWQASGVTDAQITFSCAAGSIQFANDKGIPFSCEKGGLGSWTNVTNGSITVTPIGNTTAVTVPFTLSLTKNGYPTGQSHTENVTFPATARVPRPPAPISTSTTSRPFEPRGPATTDVDTQPAASGCLNLSNSLRYRTRDAQVNGEVSALQDFLQSKGYLNSEPTGFMGLLTVQAAKQFQQDNGISPTGFIGEVTKAKIRQISCGR